jgi:hypothetical protein
MLGLALLVLDITEFSASSSLIKRRKTNLAFAQYRTRWNEPAGLRAVG